MEQAEPLVHDTVDGNKSRADLEKLIDRKVWVLQEKYLSGEAASAGSLARLRKSLGKPPGSHPEVWDETLAGVSPNTINDEPTHAERAAHIAMTLYAFHQQSQTKPMHKKGVSLGHAARNLAHKVGGDGAAPAVLRRFQAIGTASSIEEVEHHCRGLIARLRSEAIPLDYGLFAKHLLWLQHSDYADTTRLSWGRDYYGPNRENAEESEPSTMGETQ